MDTVALEIELLELLEDEGLNSSNTVVILCWNFGNMCLLLNIQKLLFALKN
jgi:hypothetical protein